MLFPAFNDYIGILVYYSFYFLEVVCFDFLFLKKFKLLSVPYELGQTSITFYMYMQWFMFFTVKEERKPEKSKYLWNKIYLLYLFLFAKIGIIFDTAKFLAKKELWIGSLSCMPCLACDILSVKP